MADTKAAPPARRRSAPPAARSARTVLLRRARELALVPALLLLMVLGAFVNDSFLTERNLISILGASAALAMVVLAESLVLITGKFDLSLESVVGIAPAVGALLVLPAAQSGWGTEFPAALALLAILVVGGAIGAFNGILVVKFKLNAFIVTLAMLIVLRGLLVGATKGKTLFGMPDGFYSLATTTFLTIPLSVWLAAVAFAHRRLRPQVPPRRARAVRDRRQPGRGPRRRHPRRARACSACSSSRASSPRSAASCRPATSARSAPTRART